MIEAQQKTAYIAKLPDTQGRIAYTPEEDAIWSELYDRQLKVIEGRACEEYLHGLELLNLPGHRVPQCAEVSKVLERKTGWSVVPVAALIPFGEFFQLLANRQFPAASFIRSREELDYLKEPDIFHEIFGHCPLLTQPWYADFVHHYGKIGLAAPAKDRSLLARLFWFTIEFGLIKTKAGLRVYGAGILSSKEETIYALEDVEPQRKPFHALDALRTAYRYDVKQSVYFFIESYRELFDLAQQDLLGLLAQARALGEHAPNHPAHGC